jgi:hypothetical protein
MTGGMGMRKTGLRGRGTWLARSLAVLAAALMLGVSLTGAAQAQPGRNLGATVIGPAASVGAHSSAVSTKECFYTYPTCSSSDPAVKFTIVSEGDTSACTFKTTTAWGDKSSTTKTYPGGADGSTIATFEHTYKGGHRTYTITVTSQTTVGGCGNASGTLDFTLAGGTCTAGADRGPAGHPAAATSPQAAQCSYCPAPARPSAPAAPAASASQASYFYAQAYTPETTGDYAAGNFKVAAPKVDAGDCHSLAELAVASEKTMADDRENIIEVGWTVDPALADGHDPNLPHLFVFYWVKGKEGCYDTRCKGFEKSGDLVGSVLATGSKPALSIEYRKGDWDIFDGKKLVGFYPDTLWDKAFTKFHLVEWFGEVAAAPGATKTCTEMGNGLYATNDDADTIGAMTLRNDNKKLKPSVFTRNVTPNFYSVERTSETSVRFGGQGSCGPFG